MRLRVVMPAAMAAVAWALLGVSIQATAKPIDVVPVPQPIAFCPDKPADLDAAKGTFKAVLQAIGMTKQEAVEALAIVKQLQVKNHCAELAKCWGIPPCEVPWLYYEYIIDSWFL